MRSRSVLAAVVGGVVLVAMVLAGLYVRSSGRGGAGAARRWPAVVSAPATLLPDGTVPWVDEPAGEDEFNAPPPGRRAAEPGTKACRADQLSGRLDRWWRPSGTGGEPLPSEERMLRAAALIGEVQVTNVSGRACTLQGEVDVRLLAGGREVPLLYSHALNQAARRRLTVVPPGGRAALRIDWSGPFCDQLGGPLELDIALPHDGGHLRAPVAGAETPHCFSSELHPNLSSALSASGFDEPGVPARLDSPLNPVKVKVRGPATARPGQAVTYQVSLSNPTARPLSLDPCPGYIQELFSMGSASYEAVNTSLKYRLNCRPVRAIPAHGTVRFAMVARVPGTLTAGREFAVTWRLWAPHLDPNGNPHQDLLVLRIV